MTSGSDSSSKAESNKPTKNLSRISRNNKNRGREFERVVADALGWTRVPYSGGQKEWGGADVVDGFFKKKGFWAAECKTHVVEGEGRADIHIKSKWIGQMIRAQENGRHGCLIVRRVRSGGKPGIKGPLPYVFMFEDTWEWFQTQLPGVQFAEVFCYSASRGNGQNFVVDEEWLPHATVDCVLRIAVNRKSVLEGTWYCMSLAQFTIWVHAYCVMESNDANTDQ